MRSSWSTSFYKYCFDLLTPVVHVCFIYKKLFSFIADNRNENKYLAEKSHKIINEH